MNYLKSLYVSIRMFIQPYYVNKKGWVSLSARKKLKKKEKFKKSTKSVKKKTIVVNKHKKGKREKTDGKIKILTVNQPLNNGGRFKNLPKINTIWCYNDENTIQAFGHFEMGQGYKFINRNNGRRKKLVPKVYPKQDVPFDRTHLIPFGYHNSERDSRLLVGWDSRQNQGVLNEFEQKIKKLPFDILWLTIIERKDFGASWKYRIYRKSDRKLVGKLDLELERKMVWR